MERRLRELLERRVDGAAAGMAEYHDEARAEGRCGELDAADLRGGDDIAGDADHEQIAEPLIEDDLRGHARIRAAQHDGDRLLNSGQLTPARTRGARLEAGIALKPKLADETPIAFAERVQCSTRRDHRHGDTP